MTLTHLVTGMVTGTLGTVPLTSDVYAQIPYTDAVLDTILAKVIFDNELEVLGHLDGRVYRDSIEYFGLDDDPESPNSIRVIHPYSIEDFPQLILTEGATR